MASTFIKFGCLSVFLVLLPVVSVRSQATHYDGIGSLCSNSTQCSIKVPNSYCHHNSCLCLHNYIPLNNSICTILLGRSCGNFSDCRVPGSFCNPYPNKVCACEPGLVQFSDRFCGLGIDSPCTGGRKCDAVSSYCDGAYCRCPTNMRPDLSHTRCISSSGPGPVMNCTMLGCASFGQGGYCDQRTGNCTCRSGYQLSGSFCYEIVSGRQVLNCTTMGCASFGQGGHCDTRTGNCTCRSGYQMSGSFCYDIVSKLGEKCDKHYQICSLRRTNTTGVECDDKKCKCKKGYKASDDKYSCNSSTTIAAAISTTILALISRVMS
ncbi:multiple epidermal growth factor-like domains protein 10 isoform X1 [Anabrus simplex]|uniref:multiple epidermal growth factor-like domains protein 10 isoform X1 n=1 Tax=Anabrus simplex TaxID=316456 RepID=UPI0035A3C8BA